VGTLAPASLISPRGRAALTAGLLAVSAAAPPATIAQEPDQTREGVAAPDVPAGDRAHSPDFDPGGPTIEVPDEPAPSPEAAPSEDAADADGPLEQEAGGDAEAPIVDPGDQGAGPGASPSAPDVAPQPPVEPPAAPEAPPAAPAPPPAAQAPAGALSPAAQGQDEWVSRDRPHRSADKRASRPRGDDSRKARKQGASERRSVAGPPPSSARPAAGESDFEWVVAAATTETAQPGAATAHEPSAPTTVRDRIGRGDRTYVVRGGDSLWSVAADRLGDDASVAEIAREVSRLWELNRVRIATGDPDLLMVGTQLTLR
jgi:hypothetical protein